MCKLLILLHHTLSGKCYALYLAATLVLVQEQWGANTIYETASKLFGGDSAMIFNASIEKRSTNSNFWVRISSGGVRVVHVKGYGAKKLGMSLETQGDQTFWWRVSRKIAGTSLRCPKGLRTKKFVFNVWRLALLIGWGLVVLRCLGEEIRHLTCDSPHEPQEQKSPKKKLAQK